MEFFVSDAIFAMSTTAKDAVVPATVSKSSSLRVTSTPVSTVSN